MPVHFNRPIMAAADIDDLFKLVWDLVDTDQVAFNLPFLTYERRVADCQHAIARENLTDFIVEHHIEFFDLIQRGRDDSTLQQYERDASAKLIPCAVEDDGRKLTVREIYDAPDKKEKKNDETI